MDHERVRRHRVARHHGGFASRLLAAAARRCARPRSAPRRTWPRRPPPPHLPVDDGGDDAQLAGPQRSGEARHAAEAASRRRPRADGEPNADRGWTVFEIPSTPGSLPAVGSRSCVPHHAGSAQSGMRSSSPSPVASPGSARELGVVPHRRPDPDGAAPALSLGGK